MSNSFRSDLINEELLNKVLAQHEKDADKVELVRHL